MKRIPTFVSDDNGSIIHIIKKNNKKWQLYTILHNKIRVQLLLLLLWLQIY